MGAWIDRGAAGGTYAAARQAVEADPLSASAWHALGLSAEARGSRREAGAALRKAVALLAGDTGKIVLDAYALALSGWCH